MESGEIREVDANKFAHIFEDTYLAASYAGIPKSGEHLPEYVGNKLMAIYELMKKCVSKWRMRSKP